MLLALLAALAPAAEPALPRETLQLECHAPNLLRGTLPCTARVQRPAGAPATPLELRLYLSCCYLPVELPPELRFNEGEQAYVWLGNLDPGQTRFFDVELRSSYSIASPEREVRATLRVGNGEHVVTERVVPAHVLGHTDLLDLRLPWPPAVVFGSLLLLDVVLVVAAWRARPRRSGSLTFWAVLSVVLANLMLLMGGALIEPVRSRLQYEAFTCELLAKSSQHPQDRAPWFVLRYERRGEPQIAQGAEGAGLFYELKDAQRLDAIWPGQRLPCWVDPWRPDRAILDRGPHGGAVVALLVLVGLWRSLRRWVRLVRGE